MKIAGILEEKEILTYAQMLVRRKFSKRRLLGIAALTTALLGTIGLLPLLFGQPQLYVIAWPILLVLGIPLFYFWIPRLLLKTVLERLHKLGSQMNFQYEWQEQGLFFEQNEMNQTLAWDDLDEVWHKNDLWSLRFSNRQIAIPKRLLSEEQILFLEARENKVAWLPGLA